MKTRTGYVSNSSSSSFLVPGDAVLPHEVEAFELPEEIWKAIEKYHSDYDGNRIDLSGVSGSWKLTRFVSDCEEEYKDVCELPGAVHYLEGDQAPYGYYDDDADKYYIVLKKDGEEFYLFIPDVIGRREDDLPKAIWLRDKANEIFSRKSLNKTQKISALKNLFDF